MRSPPDGGPIAALPVVLPRAEPPEASVVIVTYGGWEWTRRALEALRDNTEPRYEVVIVDNASPDDTAERLRAEVRGATAILNEQNVGFGPAANQGAARAVGRYLVFLNSDAMVRPGWLPRLLEVLETDPRAGAVVPRFLHLDGTVQEAGSLLWRDGSTLMWGHRADPAEPGFRFRRYVDHGSAACLAIRRSTFVALGGFDPAYVPAYCEDVDLLLAMRSRGLRTVMRPGAEVDHVRFGSSGLEEDTARRMVEANTRILRERWAEFLAERPPPADPGHPARAIAARDADAVDRILVVGGVPEELREALLARYPTGRVTQLLTDDPGDLPERLLDEGLEVVVVRNNPDSWFLERRFHYSAVVAVDHGAFAAIEGPLRRTNPQASIVLHATADDLLATVSATLDQTDLPPEPASVS